MNTGILRAPVSSKFGSTKLNGGRGFYSRQDVDRIPAGTEEEGSNAIVLVTLGRAVAIYPCGFLFSRSSLRVTMKHQHLLFWGGLRAALALALALGLPTDVPQREEIITISFAVVAFSVFVQGLTMEPFLRRMEEIPR